MKVEIKPLQQNMPKELVPALQSRYNSGKAISQHFEASAAKKAARTLS